MPTTWVDPQSQITTDKDDFATLIDAKTAKKRKREAGMTAGNNQHLKQYARPTLSQLNRLNGQPTRRATNASLGRVGSKKR